MADERIDSRLFWADAALLNWFLLIQNAGGPGNPIIADPDDREEQTELAQRLQFNEVGLRWNVNAAVRVPGMSRPLGLPSGPFTVWRREPIKEDAALFEDIPFVIHTIGEFRLVRMPREFAIVRIEFNSISGGAVFSLARPDTLLSFNGFSTFAGGPSTVTLSTGRIAGLVIPSGVSITDLRGVVPLKYKEAAEWQMIETVGMPVEQAEWNDIGKHAADHGPVGAMTNPIDATLDRIQRSQAPIGWFSQVEAGVPAPPWSLTDPQRLVDEVSERLLPELRQAMELAPLDQVLHRFAEALPPPQSLDGQTVSGTSQNASLSPVQMLQVAVASDPLAALTLGYGTNIADGPISTGPFDPGGEIQLPRAQFDYMVTADFGEDLSYASLALRPLLGFRPVAPTDTEVLTRLDVTSDELVALPAAQIPPAAVDQPWRANTVIRWERPLDTLLSRPASHVVARRDLSQPQPQLLNPERLAGGPEPIAPAVARGELDGDPQDNFTHYPDRHIDIPNDPGTRQLQYAVVNQNIYGLWSQWQTASTTLAHPPLPTPLIARADFDVEIPDTGTVCPATLSVDLLWDWTDRSPDQLRLVGTMFATPNRSTELPGGPPAGLSTSLGAAGGAIVLDFSGDTASLVGAPPGSTIEHVNDQGETLDENDVPIVPGPDQGESVRRYRVTVTGLSVDFASTDHAGFGLWARAVERIAPNRTSTTTAPVYAYASSPLTVDVVPELVPLSSLPDADGASHARISWPAMAGASGYMVYQSDESSMRSFFGLDDPALDDTLSDRLTELLDAWEADPARRPFTRITREPLPSSQTSLNVVLPRGTTEISTWLVITTGPGGNESDWPTTATPGLRARLIPRATPRVARPAAPEIEALAGDTDVDLTIRLNPGHRVDRVDLYRVRVDDAARELETMGPPVATIATGTPGWNVEVDDDGAPIEMTGTDTPGQSWRRVWYRAVAWADDQWTPSGAAVPFSIAERGLIPGCSAPSNALSIEMPPLDPPDLSDILVGWPGGSQAAVEFTWTSEAPLSSPLGDHRIEVVVVDSGRADPITFSGTLEAMPITPLPVVEGIWRDSGATPASYRAVVNRSSIDDHAEITVSIIDPRGRATTRTARVPAGPTLPEPDLSGLVVTPARGGVMLTFNSSSPLRRFDGDAYTLTVSARARRPGRIPHGPGGLIPVPPRDRPFRPGFGTPQPRPEVFEPGRLLRRDRIPDRPQFDSTPFDRIPDLDLEILDPGRRPVVIEIDLPDIPLDRRLRPSTDPMQITRRRGSGTNRTYTVLTRFLVDRFDLQLRSPDGRVARASIEGPR